MNAYRQSNKISSYRQADLEGRKHFAEDFGTYYITAGTQDDTDRTDVLATAITNPNKIYTIEIKDYTNSKYERGYTKFIYKDKGQTEYTDHGYQVDYDKIDYLMKMWHEENRIPILYARFCDYTIVWDLRTIPYKERAKMVVVNADGQHYGERKELANQTYLFINEAKYKKLTQN